MNKKALLRFSITIILVVFIFLFMLLIFPVNPEDISGNVVKQEIIKTIEPISNKETAENQITIKLTTEKPALCKSSKMKFGGYYLPYVQFRRTNDYYHETDLKLDEGRNNFKFNCMQLDSKIYDYDYWSIKKI